MLGLLFTGASIIHLVAHMPWHDALYFVITTLTTVGFGDVVVTSVAGRAGRGGGAGGRGKGAEDRGKRFLGGTGSGSSGGAQGPVPLGGHRVRILCLWGDAGSGSYPALTPAAAAHLVRGRGGHSRVSHHHQLRHYHHCVQLEVKP